jgi:hypothetical protein
MSRPACVPFVIAALLLGACGQERPDGDAPVDPAGLPDAQLAFWQNLGAHCPNAFPGGLTLEPPGDDMLTGTEELVVHFRECGEREIRAPFHVEVESDGTWDRSRTWIFRIADGRLELRHDHRHQDGGEHDSNFYGGFTEDAGTPNRQEFIFTDRPAADGLVRGWRIEIHPGERYTYGTIRDGDWTWRVDFDLSRTVEPPPAPWGH